MTVFKLEYPIKVGGTDVKELNVRRPKVRDLKRANAETADEMGQTTFMLSLLCSTLDGTHLTVSDLEEIDVADMAGLAEIVAGFTERSKA